MKDIKKIHILIALISFQLILTGCSSISYDNSNEISYQDSIKDIKIEIINENIMPSGIGYSLKLINESEHVIVQNSVYVSFPITNADRSQSNMNKCKVEASGNKLFLSPGESVILNVFVQSENYEGNNFLRIEDPQIQIIGYFNELSDNNRFGIWSSFSLFDSNFKSSWGKDNID